MQRALAAGGIALMAACGGGDGGGTGIDVGAAWARTTAPGQTVGAVYFEVESAVDDSLVAVEVPATVAGSVEIHEAVVDDTSGTGSEISGTEQMSMREVERGVALPAGETVSFETGGYHVMLVDLAAPLEAGDTFELTVEFAHAEPLTVAIEIAAETEP